MEFKWWDQSTFFLFGTEKLYIPYPTALITLKIPRNEEWLDWKHVWSTLCRTWTCENVLQLTFFFLVTKNDIFVHGTVSKTSIYICINYHHRTLSSILRHGRCRRRRNSRLRHGGCRIIIKMISNPEITPLRRNIWEKSKRKKYFVHGIASGWGYRRIKLMVYPKLLGNKDLNRPVT